MIVTPPRNTHTRAGWRRTLAAAFLGVTVAALTLARLDHTPLWDDEARVAIVARNLLRSGALTGWDGRNLLGYRNGGWLRPDLSVNNPPVEFVLAALSFRLLGTTTWAARLPFALIGLAALLVFAALLRRDFPAQTALRTYAVCGWALSLVFVLNARQCRYYAPVMLLALLGFQAWRGCLTRRRWRDFAGFAAASIAFFYTHAYLCALFLVALALTALVLHRREFDRPAAIKAAAALAVLLAATLPYAWAREIWVRPDLGAGGFESNRAVVLWRHLRDLNRIGLAPLPILASGWWLGWRRRTQPPGGGPLADYACMALTFVCLVGLTSPEITSVEADAAVRFHLPAAPLWIVVAAAALARIHASGHWGRWLAPGLLGVWLTTNLLTLSPGRPGFRWLLPAYIHELSRPYPTAMSETCRHLEAHARQDDTVLAFPLYNNDPIHFHLGDRLRIAGALTRDTHLDAARLARLGAPVFREEAAPDWFVAFGAQPEAAALLQYLARDRPDAPGAAPARYERVAVLPVFWFDTSRPELLDHAFGPREDFSRDAEAVYVYRRRPRNGP